MSGIFLTKRLVGKKVPRYIIFKAEDDTRV